MAKFNVRLPVTGFIWATVKADDEKGAMEAAMKWDGEEVDGDDDNVVGLSVDCSGECSPLVIPVRTTSEPLGKKQTWLNVLTDEQKNIRGQLRYDEIDLTPEQKEALGEEWCCWITSPTFYANSHWCS